MKKNTDYTVGDSIYDGMNTNIADLKFYKQWLSKSEDACILELCCSTGRLTLPIAKNDFDICGVDYTPSMVEQAKSKAAETGLVIDFIEADHCCHIKKL